MGFTSARGISAVHPNEGEAGRYTRRMSKELLDNLKPEMEAGKGGSGDR